MQPIQGLCCLILVSKQIIKSLPTEIDAYNFMRVVSPYVCFSVKRVMSLLSSILMVRIHMMSVKERHGTSHVRAKTSGFLVAIGSPKVVLSDGVFTKVA